MAGIFGDYFNPGTYQGDLGGILGRLPEWMLQAPQSVGFPTPSGGPIYPGTNMGDAAGYGAGTDAPPMPQGQPQIPPNAQPAMGQGGPAIAPQAAPESDRLGAFMGSLGGSPTLLGGLIGGLGGLITGQRMDPQAPIERALVAKGLSPDMARFAAMNPAALQQILPSLLGPKQYQHVMMKDSLGNETPAVFDPAKGIYLDAQGKPLAGSAATGQMGAAANMPVQIDPTTGRDENFLASLNPTEKAAVEGILNGDINAQGRNMQKFLPYAARAEPGFNQQTYFSRLQAAKSWSSGKDAETVKSYNQAILHGDKAWNLIDRLPNLNVGGAVGSAINTPYLTYKAATDPQYASDRLEYDKLIQALAGELMKASRGSSMGSEREIQDWKAGALGAASKAEMRGSIRGAMDFLEGAMSASAQKKSEAFKSQFGPVDLLTPENKKAFERIKSSSETGAAPAQAAPATPAKSAVPTRAELEAEARRRGLIK